MSDSLAAIYVKPHQCPSHQSILITKGPIHEIFAKKNWEMAELENEFFLGGHFEFFKSAILIFFASSLWKIQPFYMRYHFFLHYGWFFQNLGKEAVRTFMHTTVCPPNCCPHTPPIFSPSDGPVIHGSSGCSWWIPFIARDSGVISLPKVTLFILIVFVRPQLWQRDTSSLIARPARERLPACSARPSGVAGWPAGLGRHNQ